MKNFIILFVIFAWLVSFPVVLIRFLYGILIIPITKYFCINYFLSSLILSSFFVGYVIFNLPVNYLIDKYGYKLIGISLLFFSILIILFTIIHNYIYAIILMILIGAAATPTYSGSIKLLSNKIKNYRASAIGILNTTGPFILLLSSFTLPLIIEKLSWQLIFIYFSLFTFILSIPFFIIKNDSDKYNKKPITKNAILASTVRFFAFWGMWGTSTYLFLFLQNLFHFNLIYAGLITATFAIGGLFSVFTIGFISDFFKKRKEISEIFLFLFFLILIIYPFLPIYIIWFSSFLLGFIAFGYKTPLDTYISEITKGKEATSIGLANLISQPSSIITPIIIGYLITFTDNIIFTFIFLSIGPLVAFLLISKLK